MMFILREKAGAKPPAGLIVKASRQTPVYADASGGTDHFFDSTADDAGKLSAAGHRVVMLNDGWYELREGGVAIWGDGRHWEIRDTPFTVTESSG